MALIIIIQEIINTITINYCFAFVSIVKHIDRVQPDRVGEIIIPSCIPLLYTFYQDETSGEIHAQGTKKSTLGMLGRFFVTKELLELSVKANQNLEMSENLDESDSFKDMLLKALHEMLVPRAGTGNSNKVSVSGGFCGIFTWCQGLLFMVP